MKSLKECLTEININESKKDSFMMEIKREPLQLNINVDLFRVYVYADKEYDFKLTYESQLNEFVELWKNTVDNGDDFEFVTDVDIAINNQFGNKSMLMYSVEYEYEDGYLSRTPVCINDASSNGIGLSKEDIEKIITQVHNNFLEGDYAADEVAEELYDLFVN